MFVPLGHPYSLYILNFFFSVYSTVPTRTLLVKYKNMFFENVHNRLRYRKFVWYYFVHFNIFYNFEPFHFLLYYDWFEF